MTDFLCLEKRVFTSQKLGGGLTSMIHLFLLLPFLFLLFFLLLFFLYLLLLLPLSILSTDYGVMNLP